MSCYLQQIKISLILLLVFTLLTGIVYPFLVAGIAQVLFPWQANGSLLVRENELVGSALLGQSFTDPRYFWGRPSATPVFPYNATYSGGSNLGPTNPALIQSVKDRIALLKTADPTHAPTFPADLVTTSGSGLDPDISVFAALYQVPRIMHERGLSASQVKKLIDKYQTPKTWGIIGEERVNILRLNLALDQLENKTHG